MTTSSGTAGFINSNLQYLGNQGNILQYGEVNAGGNNTDLATYGSNGIAPFANYKVLTFNSTNTLSANAGDIVLANASAAGPYTLTTAANLSVGALLINNATVGLVLTVAVANSLTVSSGLLMFEGSGASTQDIITSNTVNLGSTGLSSAAAEGIIFNNNTGSGTGNSLINSVLSGTNLTLGGARRPTY